MFSSAKMRLLGRGICSCDVGVVLSHGVAMSDSTVSVKIRSVDLFLPPRSCLPETAPANAIGRNN